MNGSALFSADKKYRYRLFREWDAEGGAVLFVMLNPSTADAEKNDPTIRRCIKFAETWGYGALYVGNIFAFRATKPADLKKAFAPIGANNDLHLTEMHHIAELTVCAWGSHGSFHGRGRRVIDMLRSAVPNRDLFALGLTDDKQPRHPLYVSGVTLPTAI